MRGTKRRALVSPLEAFSFVATQAATLIVDGIILQVLWPDKEFTFVLKTSSNDVHKDLDALQSAIETAFIERA